MSSVSNSHFKPSQTVASVVDCSVQAWVDEWCTPFTLCFRDLLACSLKFRAHFGPCSALENSNEPRVKVNPSKAALTLWAILLKNPPFLGVVYSEVPELFTSCDTLPWVSWRLYTFSPLRQTSSSIGIMKCQINRLIWVFISIRPYRTLHSIPVTIFFLFHSESGPGDVLQSQCLGLNPEDGRINFPLRIWLALPNNCLRPINSAAINPTYLFHSFSNICTYISFNNVKSKWKVPRNGYLIHTNEFQAPSAYEWEGVDKRKYHLFFREELPEIIYALSMNSCALYTLLKTVYHSGNSTTVYLLPSMYQFFNCNLHMLNTLSQWNKSENQLMHLELRLPALINSRLVLH